MKKLLFLSIALLATIANINCSDASSSLPRFDQDRLTAWLSENAKKHNHSREQLVRAWELLDERGAIYRAGEEGLKPTRAINEISQQTGISEHALLELIGSYPFWQVPPLLVPPLISSGMIPEDAGQ